MILELLEYLTTPCSWTARKLGYLNGQIGIKVRHRQCRRAWKSHLEKTRQVIRAAILECPRRRKAVVLGSGLLLDVPLADLAAAFDEVVLVDVVHPISVYLTKVRYRNVRLVRADVTETAVELAKVANNPALPLPHATPQRFCNDTDVDYVVSVNLLSQLPYVPTYYLEKTTRNEKEVDEYARDLIDRHLDYLQRLPGVVTLITDVAKLKIDNHGEIVERVDILYGATLPWQTIEWTWEHIPLKHVSPEFAYHRHVCAVQDVKSASAAK
ncbi:MAG: hypothetical protein U0941_12270 [Planctomycetaceae bacterium]